MINLSDFEAKVPVTIAGLIRGALVENKEYVGAEIKRDGNELFIIAGLSLERLAELGLDSTASLVKLHSMNNRGSVELVRFHNDEQYLGFLMTSSLKTILRNDPRLKVLTEIEWDLLVIEDSDSEEPDRGRLRPVKLTEDDICKVRYDYLNQWFEDATEVSIEQAIANYEKFLNQEKLDEIRTSSGETLNLEEDEEIDEEYLILQQAEEADLNDLGLDLLDFEEPEERLTLDESLPIDG